MTILSNPAAERGILAGLCKFGGEAFYEVSDIITDNSFLIDSNIVLYRCLRHLFEKDPHIKIDLPSVYSSASELGLEYFFEKKTEVQHLQAILSFPVVFSNLRRFAAQLRKLEIARRLNDELEIAQDKLLEVTGSESITEILGIAENSILGFSSKLNNDGDSPIHTASSIEEYIKKLEEEKTDAVGLPSGYPAYDTAIGSLRPGIHIIGARPKIGKSSFASNIASYLAQLNVPVLKLDLEMLYEEDTNRLISSMSGVDIKLIETGKFTENPSDKTKVYEAMEKIKKMPYHFQSIAGKSPEEIIAIARRWIMKEVGLASDGTAKRPCLIIYDYLRTSNAEQVARAEEHQVIGFIMSSLSSFYVKYKVPILLFSQLNRDGINKSEETDIISGSDRISWICTSLSILKPKSEEEIAMDGAHCGNRKLFTIVSRHGPATENRNYINLDFKKSCTKLVYLGTKAEIQAREKQNTFEVEEDTFENS